MHYIKMDKSERIKGSAFGESSIPYFVGPFNNRKSAKKHICRLKKILKRKINCEIV